MSSSTALTTAPKLYEPVFNPDTNTYADECPWPKGWRGPREPHKCFCNAIRVVDCLRFHRILFVVNPPDT